jgi:hypothetical protein
LVDARDLGSRDESRGGSSPSARTSRAVFPKLGRDALDLAPLKSSADAGD